MNFGQPAVEKNFSSDQAQEMIDALVLNDQETYLNMEYARSFMERLKADTGFDSPWAEQKYQRLAGTYTNRQNEIKNSRYLKAHKWVDDKLNAFYKWLGLGSTPNTMGAIPVAAAAVGGAVIGAGLLLIVWQIFKPHYSDSTVDLKVSRDLKSALEKVSPETANKILADLENQVDDAYKAGQNQGAIQQIFNLLKIGGISALAIWLFLKAFPIVSEQVKETQKKLETS